MNTEHQALTDVPLWLLVLLSMAGLSGEMLRASGTDLGLRQILQRVALRFLASGLLGMATLLLALALWSNLYLAAGLGIVIAVIGADVAGGLYTQFLAKKPASVESVMTQPNSKAEYYQMKGMVADLPAEDQAEVMKAEAEVIAIARRSDKALIGALMAMTKIAAES